MIRRAQTALVSPLRSAVPLRVVLWASFLSCVAIGLAVALVLGGWRLGNPYAVVALAVVAGVAEAGRVRLTSTLEQSISLVPTLFAAVMFGPLASMFVAAASFSVDFRRPYLKWWTYTSSRAITGALAGLAVIEIPASGENTFASYVLATVIAATVAESLDLLFAVCTTALRGNSVSQAPEDADTSRSGCGVAVRANRCSLRVCVPGGLPLDTRVLLWSGARRSATLRHVPRSATACRGSLVRQCSTGAGQPVVRNRSRSNARRPRSLHSWSLSRGGHLCARYRRTAGSE